MGNIYKYHYLRLLDKIHGETKKELDESLEKLLFAEIKALMNQLGCDLNNLLDKVANYKGVKK